MLPNAADAQRAFITASRIASAVTLAASV